MDVHDRTDTRLSRAAGVVPTTVMIMLVTFAAGALGRTVPSTSVASPPAPTSVARPVGGPPADRLVLRLPHGTASLSLQDTAVARAFSSTVPSEVTFRDPLGQAKTFRLPRPLPTTGMEHVLDPEAGGLYYWPPSGDVAIFYDDLGQTVPPPGLVPLGTVASGLDPLAEAGPGSRVFVEQV